MAVSLVSCIISKYSCQRHYKYLGDFEIWRSWHVRIAVSVKRIERWPKKKNVVAFYQHTVLLFGLRWSTFEFLSLKLLQYLLKKARGFCCLTCYIGFFLQNEIGCKGFKMNGENGWKCHRYALVKHRNGWECIISRVNGISCLNVDVKLLWDCRKTN